MSIGLPKLPGYDFPDPTKTNFNRSQIFGYKNGIPIQVEKKAALPLAGATVAVPDLPLPDEGGETAEIQAAADFVPAWVAFDRKVLRFEAFFKEPVHESAAENFRIRKCVVLYYLEDDSMQVSEPKVENSGIPQGVFIKRHRIPKPDEAYAYYTYNDLGIGAELPMYGRTFRLVNADGFTTKFYAEKLGVDLGVAEEFPDDPYSTMRETAKLFATAKGTPYLAFPPNRKFDDLTQFVEARLGMATHIINVDKLRSFLDNDRNVLRFYCVWDDTDRLFGDKRPFILHFFLADNTVEVLEVQQPNSGRDPFPQLVKRCKLPVDSASPSGPFVQIENLGIGKTVNIYGKDLLMYAADKHTTEWFAENKGIALEPLDVSDPPPPEPMMEVPPHNGIGEPEDSLQNVLHLIPKAQKKDFKKFMLQDRKILRFQAHMVTDKPEDVDRQFIIAIYLADDTVAVYEPPMRNSGIIGGKFLERGRAIDPVTSDYYMPVDFFVGALVTIYSQAFKIHKCDQYTLNFMEENCGAFPMADGSRVQSTILSVGGLKEAVEAKSPGGTIDVVDLKAVLEEAGVTLVDQEIISLLRMYDADGTGSIDYAALFSS